MKKALGILFLVAALWVYCGCNNGDCGECPDGHSDGFIAKDSTKVDSTRLAKHDEETGRTVK